VGGIYLWKPILHLADAESHRANIPLNEYSYEQNLFAKLVCGSCIGSVTLPGTPKVLSGASTCSQTYHNHSCGTSIPVIRDPSYFKGWTERPPSVWYSSEIDSFQYTCHIRSDTPWDSQWLKSICLTKIRWEVPQMLMLDALVNSWLG